MLTIFLVLLLLVFGDIFIFAMKAAWSITKILFTILFFPLILIGIAIFVSLYLSLGLLIVFWIFSFFFRR